MNVTRINFKATTILPNSNKKYTQYLSKWRGTWKYFTNRFGNRYEPNKMEITEHLKFKYKLR